MNGVFIPRLCWIIPLFGLFTVVGGVASVVVSLFFGFNLTLLTGALIYLLALFLFKRMKMLYAPAG